MVACVAQSLRPLRVCLAAAVVGSAGEVVVGPYAVYLCMDGTRSPLVVLRSRGEVTLVLWAHAMRQVSADRAFRDTLPIVLDVTDAVYGRNRRSSS